MRFAVSILTVVGFVASSDVFAGGSCEQAARGLERAQQELSSATRDADTRGSAYHTCMQGGKVAQCAPQKRAWEGAITRRSRAIDALRIARDARDAACR